MDKNQSNKGETIKKPEIYYSVFIQTQYYNKNLDVYVEQIKVHLHKITK